jgi:murein L,D-transpeptidase YafK
MQSNRQRNLAGCTLAVFALLTFSSLLPSQPPTTPAKVDSILILKKVHLLELISGGKVIGTYHVALGQGGLARKQKEDDARTPEGHYAIDARNAASHYHKALDISYPNAEDRLRPQKMGVSPGGAIMIHGLPNGTGYIGAAHRLYDWTLGSIAVTDSEIDEIWTMTPVGTPVEIRP